MAPAPYGNGSADTFASLRRHGEYYLTGGDLFVLVTPIHFRIHRYFFERESEYFQKKLAGPMTPGNVRQGGSESTAIMIDDVTPDEFAKFLWVFYNPRYSLYEANLEDWKQILDLADRWTFPEVKALCIRQLQQPAIVMQDLEKICLYHRYSIDRNFLIPHYIAIVLREQPPTLEEGTEMGMSTTVATYTAREIVRSEQTKGAALEALVRRLFEVPDPVLETHDGSLTPHSPSYFHNGLPGKFDMPQTHGNTPAPLTVSTSTPKFDEPLKSTTGGSSFPPSSSRPDLTHGVVSTQRATAPPSEPAKTALPTKAQRKAAKEATAMPELTTPLQASSMAETAPSDVERLEIGGEEQAGSSRPKPLDVKPDVMEQDSRVDVVSSNKIDDLSVPPLEPQPAAVKASGKSATKATKAKKKKDKETRALNDKSPAGQTPISAEKSVPVPQDPVVPPVQKETIDLAAHAQEPAKPTTNDEPEVQLVEVVSEATKDTHPSEEKRTEQQEPEIVQETKAEVPVSVTASVDDKLPHDGSVVLPPASDETPIPQLDNADTSVPSQTADIPTTKVELPQPASEEPAPVEPAPIEPAPVESAPVDAVVDVAHESEPVPADTITLGPSKGAPATANDDIDASIDASKVSTEEEEKAAPEPLAQSSDLADDALKPTTESLPSVAQEPSGEETTAGIDAKLDASAEAASNDPEPVDVSVPSDPAPHPISELTEHKVEDQETAVTVPDDSIANSEPEVNPAPAVEENKVAGEAAKEPAVPETTSNATDVADEPAPAVEEIKATDEAAKEPALPEIIPNATDVAEAPAPADIKATDTPSDAIDNTGANFNAAVNPVKSEPVGDLLIGATTEDTTMSANDEGLAAKVDTAADETDKPASSTATQQVSSDPEGTTVPVISESTEPASAFLQAKAADLSVSQPQTPTVTVEGPGESKIGDSPFPRDGTEVPAQGVPQEFSTVTGTSAEDPAAKVDAVDEPSDKTETSFLGLPDAADDPTNNNDDTDSSSTVVPDISNRAGQAASATEPPASASEPPASAPKPPVPAPEKSAPAVEIPAPADDTASGKPAPANDTSSKVVATALATTPATDKADTSKAVDESKLTKTQLKRLKKQQAEAAKARAASATPDPTPALPPVTDISKPPPAETSVKEPAPAKDASKEPKPAPDDVKEPVSATKGPANDSTQKEPEKAADDIKEPAPAVEELTKPDSKITVPEAPNSEGDKQETKHASSEVSKSANPTTEPAKPADASPNPANESKPSQEGPIDESKLTKNQLKKLKKQRADAAKAREDAAAAAKPSSAEIPPAIDPSSTVTSGEGKIAAASGPAPPEDLGKSDTVPVLANMSSAADSASKEPTPAPPSLPADAKASMIDTALPAAGPGDGKGKEEGKETVDETKMTKSQLKKLKAKKQKEAGSMSPAMTPVDDLKPTPATPMTPSKDLPPSASPIIRPSPMEFTSAKPDDQASVADTSSVRGDDTDNESNSGAKLNKNQKKKLRLAAAKRAAGVPTDTPPVSAPQTPVKDHIELRSASPVNKKNKARLNDASTAQETTESEHKAAGSTEPPSAQATTAATTATSTEAADAGVPLIDFSMPADSETTKTEVKPAQAEGANANMESVEPVKSEAEVASDTSAIPPPESKEGEKDGVTKVLKPEETQPATSEATKSQPETKLEENPAQTGDVLKPSTETEKPSNEAKQGEETKPDIQTVNEEPRKADSDEPNADSTPVDAPPPVPSKDDSVPTNTEQKPVPLASSADPDIPDTIDDESGSLTPTQTEMDQDIDARTDASFATVPEDRFGSEDGYMSLDNDGDTTVVVPLTQSEIDARSTPASEPQTAIPPATPAPDTAVDVDTEKAAERQRPVSPALSTTSARGSSSKTSNKPSTKNSPSKPNKLNGSSSSSTAHTRSRTISQSKVVPPSPLKSVSNATPTKPPLGARLASLGSGAKTTTSPTTTKSMQPPHAQNQETSQRMPDGRNTPSPAPSNVRPPAQQGGQRSTQQPNLRVETDGIANVANAAKNLWSSWSKK